MKPDFPLYRLVPNAVTLLALCAGLSAIRFSLTERWEWAVGMIIIAIILDGMDGRLARLLNASSPFGAQLDSLADFMNFGVAPSFVMYLWIMREIKGVGWAVVLFFSICAALRLARFNTGLTEEKKEPWRHLFFTGVPAPGGAGLALLPLYLDLQFDDSILGHPAVACIYVAVIGVLMSSRLPTYSIKHIRISQDYVRLWLVGLAVCIVFFLTEPWLFLITICLVYFAFMPVSVIHYLRLTRQPSDDLPPS